MSREEEEEDRVAGAVFLSLCVSRYVAYILYHLLFE
jgi:hypothetical protein